MRPRSGQMAECVALSESECGNCREKTRKGRGSKLHCGVFARESALGTCRSLERGGTCAGGAVSGHEAVAVNDGSEQKEREFRSRTGHMEAAAGFEEVCASAEMMSGECYSRGRNPSRASLRRCFLRPAAALLPSSRSGCWSSSGERRHRQVDAAGCRGDLSAPLPCPRSALQLRHCGCLPALLPDLSPGRR